MPSNNDGRGASKALSFKMHREGFRGGDESVRDGGCPGRATGSLQGVAWRVRQVQVCQCGMTLLGKLNVTRDRLL